MYWHACGLCQEQRMVRSRHIGKKTVPLTGSASATGCQLTYAGLRMQQQHPCSACQAAAHPPACAPPPHTL